MKKIKVLHIAQSNGGVAEYLKMLIKYMDKDKFEIYLLASKEYESERNNFEKINCNLYTIDMKREISLISDLKAIFNINACVKKVRPDIIHLHSSKAGALGRIATMFSHIPIVYNAHGWAFDMNVSNHKKLFYAYIERILAKFTDVIVDISNFEKNNELRYEVKPKRYIKVIYNGIDLDRYKIKYDTERIKKELRIPDGAFVVGMVARISEQKSPGCFVEMARMIKEKLDNCYFILVGDGELRNNIEKLIAKYDLKNNFLITGWTNEVPKYMSLFDVGVLTSRWEGFGLVLAEYMACKKPVAAFNSGGISDVVENNYNGLLFDYGDIKNFSDSIIRLKSDCEFRNKLVYNGYKVVNKKFNVERVAKEHEDVYFNLINDKVENGNEASSI